jgi:hypothetical protein
MLQESVSFRNNENTILRNIIRCIVVFELEI